MNSNPWLKAYEQLKHRLHGQRDTKRLLRSRYPGEALRAIRAVKGIGRPPNLAKRG